MKIYMVAHEHCDGIDYDFKLFKNEHSAKTHCRMLNKVLGFIKYTITTIEVSND